VDNSFGPSFAEAKMVEFYVQSGATTFQQLLTALADNLNAICMEEDLGIRFTVVIVPGGQQYTLASQHLIDSYVGGWICDYAHVLNWLRPMYCSTGTYFSWNLWNITRLDTLYEEAVLADRAGDIESLLARNDEMNTLANQLLPYMVWWHPVSFFTRSTWLQGWYVNPNYGVDLWSAMYYEEAPALPRTLEELQTAIAELGADGAIDNQGIARSLLAKLNVAQRLVDKGKIEEARSILEEDFIPQIQNLTSTHITVEAADLLIQSAEYILSHL
jgi:hypothetical protein